MGVALGGGVAVCAGPAATPAQGFLEAVGEAGEGGEGKGGWVVCREGVN